MKILILIGLLSIITGCATIDEQHSKKPDAIIESQKGIDEFTNCVLNKTALILPLTKTKTLEGYRLAKGELGYAGVTIYINENKAINKLNIVAYIPSSSWAIAPKKILNAVKSCA